MNKACERYVIFLDIDGTIRGESDEALQKNLATIQQVRLLGHKVFVNTGRATSYMPKELNVSKNFDGVISGAGAVVTMDGRVLFKKLMPYKTVKNACEVFATAAVPCVLEGERDIYYFGNIEGAEENWIKLDKSSFGKVLALDTPIEKFTVLGQVSDKIIDALKPEVVVLQHPHYGEIILNDCSKSKAMEIVADELDLTMSSCIAMGDSMNDFDMIKAAGIGVAMGNAIDEIKAIADFVTRDVDEAGVSEALCRIFNLK